MIAFISAGASHAKNIFVFQVFKLDGHSSIYLTVLIPLSISQARHLYIAFS